MFAASVNSEYIIKKKDEEGNMYTCMQTSCGGYMFVFTASVPAEQ